MPKDAVNMETYSSHRTNRCRLMVSSPSLAEHDQQLTQSLANQMVIDTRQSRQHKDKANERQLELYSLETLNERIYT